MGKIKKSKLIKNIKKNISFLSSKHKHIINKENKKTKKRSNPRTLDALNQYGGYGYLNNTELQNGGFIIDYIKLKYKLSQFKSFLNKFRKEEKNIQKYIDSYKGKTTTIKQLGDDKFLEVGTYIVNFRIKTIFEFVNANRENEKEIKTSNLEDQIKLVDIKIGTINEKIKSLEKLEKKEIPKFNKYNKKLKKDSKNFLKLVKYFKNKLTGYFVKLQQIRTDYETYRDKKKIDSEAKAKVKKYKRFSTDIDFMLSFKETEVQNMNNIKEELDTILDTGKDYDEQFKSMAKENYIKDLEEWKTNYTSIYDNFKSVNENINSVSENFEIIKNNFEGMLNQTRAIYITGTSNNKDIQQATLEIKNNIDKFLKILSLITKSVTSLKLVLLKETPALNINIDLLYIEGCLKDIQNKLKEYVEKMPNDLENINNHLSKPVQKGGATKEFYEMTCDEFFDLDYNDFETKIKKEMLKFKNANDNDIKDKNSYPTILTLFSSF